MGIAKICLYISSIKKIKIVRVLRINMLSNLWKKLYLILAGLIIK